MTKNPAQSLSNAIKEKAKTVQKTQHSAAYHGTPHLVYSLPIPELRSIAETWVGEHANISFSEFLDVLAELSQAPSHDELISMGVLLGYLPQFRAQLTPSNFEPCLVRLDGWAEVDCLCQNTFPPEQFLNDWSVWKKFLQKLAQDENINKRRASIVLLTGPVAKSADPRLAKLSFELIDQLKNEKPILITKAISWLLRSLVKNHRTALEIYLAENRDTLPKIAVREVTVKLLTGVKNPRKVKKQKDEV